MWYPGWDPGTKRKKEWNLNEVQSLVVMYQYCFISCDKCDSDTDVNNRDNWTGDIQELY